MENVYILPQSYGYGFTVGLGSAFAILMVLITFILKKYAAEVQDSERFTTASRSIKSGLISSAVVSSWTWPVTLLVSGMWAYNYGIVGPYWYAAAGVVQISIFTVVAVEMKRVCPGAHTIAEIIKVRFGKTSHWIFILYCLATNCIVSGCILLGGSQAINVTTGMNVIAACFLLPFGVLIYTLFGGLKATFLSDWIHTVIIFVIIAITYFVTYGSGHVIGSPGKMYDLLVELAIKDPCTTGYKGSYLTMRNKEAVISVWNVMLGGFACVFGDPSYGQKAIASSSKTTLTGYILGGLAWSSIPWTLGTAAGLAAIALQYNPIFFTYPNKLSPEDSAKGLPVIYAMDAILGRGGAAAGVLMIFMSVTSALSAELVSCSSILTYDIYRSYINPNASGKTLVRFSHLFVFSFGIISACLAIIFNYIGVTTGWLLGFIGIVTGPTVAGVILCFFWSKLSKYAFDIGLILATITGIVCWIGSCYAFYGAVDRNTLLNTDNSLVGNFTAIFSSPIYMTIINLIKPENFDIRTMDNKFISGDDADEKEIEAMKVDRNSKESQKLKRSSLAAIIIATTYILTFMFLVPFAMYGSNYIFSKKFFTGWVIIVIIWFCLAALYIILTPIIQSLPQLKLIYNRLKSNKNSVKSKDSYESFNGNDVNDSTTSKSLKYNSEININDINYEDKSITDSI